MLQPGSIAPDFSLPDADMETHNLSDCRGKTVVLYFYPKDDTPGCTTQAIEFSDLEQAFDKQNTVVLGVSKDDCMSHAAFRDKHGLAVTLLSDEEGAVCSLYDVWQQRENDSTHKPGILRSTFIIDAQGVLQHVQYGVVAKGHAHEVLTLVQAYA